VRSGAEIGRDCVVGGGVFIDTGVEVGDRVKIENNAMLFSPAVVGDGALIGPGACLTNDRSPRAVAPDGTLKTRSDWEPAGVVVGEGAAVGAMAVVLPGVSIGPWAMVGAGATVVRDVPAHGLVLGSPARQVGLVCRCGERLSESLLCTCGRSYEATEAGLRLLGDV
jgi:acetyltransferase-like isoleucine patch superfamily enzyme